MEVWLAGLLLWLGEFDWNIACQSCVLLLIVLDASLIIYNIFVVIDSMAGDGVGVNRPAKKTKHNG